jgi:hypothetical protein
MRVPRVRFTVRRMMIAVAIIGATLGSMVSIVNWLTWSRDCHRRASVHRRAGDYESLMAGDHRPEYGFHPYLATKYERRAAHHVQMRLKWERAAWHPWTQVAPDPPEPK